MTIIGSVSAVHLDSIWSMAAFDCCTNEHRTYWLPNQFLISAAKESPA